MTLRTFLVTGAAGFIGSHSVDRLLDQGHRVIGVDNLRTGYLHNLSQAQFSPQFTFVDADVRNESAMRQLFKRYKFSGVLHLAALVSVPESFENPALNYCTNVTATDLLARLCVDYDCKRVVFASSSAVYGNNKELPNRESAHPQPLSPYAAAKLAAEIMLLGYGACYDLEVVCLRYFNVYGLRQDPSSPYSGVLSIFIERYQAGLPVIVFGDGEQTRDFVSVHDVARINCQALTAETITIGHYNVCTGNALSLNQVLAFCKRVYPNAPNPQYDKPRIGDVRHSVGDPKLLERVLSLKAKIPFEEGLRVLINMHKKTHKST